MTPTLLEKRIRFAGLTISLGLLVQLVTLLWTHALSFMLFLVVGIPLVLVGMVLFLYSLVSVKQ